MAEGVSWSGRLMPLFGLKGTAGAGEDEDRGPSIFQVEKVRG